jgi:hypothetical protein
LESGTNVFSTTFPCSLTYTNIYCKKELNIFSFYLGCFEHVVPCL